MDDDVMTESPEEKAFFDSQGSETAPEPVVQPEPELPLEEGKTPEPVAVEEPKRKDTVPLAVLLEERAKYKKLNERIERLQNMIEPKEEARPLDPEADPIGALKAITGELNGFKEREKSFAEVQQIATIGQQAAQQFRQAKPDFDDAYNHLRIARANQLMEAGEVSTPEELNHKILSEEKEIIQLCSKMGVSPAAFMYHLAGAAGYAPKQAEPVKEVPPQPTPEEKVKMAAEGQKKAANPVSKAGSGNAGPIDLKAVLQLDDDEFDKATSGRNWKKLAGG